MSHRPILAVAPNGAYKQKVDHPALPLSTSEIVECALRATEVGATLFHLHIRDQTKQHSLDPDIYLRTIDAIKEWVGDDLVIQITSEAANVFTPAQQIKSIKAVKPECVSIALREIIPNPSFTASAQALFDWCAEHQTRIQYILYSEAELLTYFDYIETGIVPNTPHSVLFVLGRYQQNRPSGAEDLAAFTRHQAKFIAPWMVCAFGASEQARLLDAALQGGHIRQGFENNILTIEGTAAKDNTEQLRNTVTALKARGLSPANITQTRKILQTRKQASN